MTKVSMVFAAEGVCGGEESPPHFSALFEFCRSRVFSFIKRMRKPLKIIATGIEYDAVGRGGVKLIFNVSWSL